MYCEIDNEQMLCKCGYKAGGRNWVRRCPLKTKSQSPGVHLRNLLKAIGATTYAGCGCSRKVIQMDVWGITGCREHRAEIVEHLKAAYKKTGWADFAAASAKAITSGLAFKLNPLDPFGSLVDEAIRLAEVSPPAT